VIAMPRLICLICKNPFKSRHGRAICLKCRMAVFHAKPQTPESDWEARQRGRELFLKLMKKIYFYLK